MGYRLGVDLGTTYCAAAVNRNGRAEMMTLGNRASSVPSVAYVRDDSEVLVGESAERRASSDPARSAREFKRRLGDPIPIVLGGQTFAAEELMALQLPPIVRLVAERQGEAPAAITLTVPANWSPHRRQIFTTAVSSEHLPPINVITEPEAAAIHYAENERIEPGEIVAVYDLGGGTFDAAILRRTVDAFEVLGEPEGIDRLGGIDFDAAVFSHVNRVLDGALDELDMNDSIVAAGLAQLRASCIEAKEALSEESDTEISVMLPGLRTDIRMTRSELEAMIRPALSDSVGALRRAMESANVVPEDVTVVLLVGGSSRIPLVAQLVGSELGRPVAVDAHPKHAIALGAALAPHPAFSNGAATTAPATSAVATTVPVATPAPVATPVVAAATPQPIAQPAPQPAPQPVAQAPVEAPFVQPDQGQKFAADAKSSFPVPLVAGIVAIIAVAGIAFAVLSGGGEEGTTGVATDETAEGTAVEDNDLAEETDGGDGEVPEEEPAEIVDTTTTAAPETTTTTTATTTTTTTATTTTLPPNPCDALNAPFVCMDTIQVVDGRFSIAFTPNGFTPDTSADHIHFYFNVNTIVDNVLNAGTGGPAPGTWVIWDAPNPATPFTVQQAVDAGATELCALMAGSAHTVNLGTGHCTDISDLLS